MRNSSIVFLILLFWMSATPTVAMRASHSEPLLVNGAAE
jgi:hypothetical protein